MKVYPVLSGELTANWGLQVLGESLSKTLPSPSYLYYIEGAAQKIVVDTSFGDPTLSKALLGEECKRAPENELKPSLARFGVEPEDIDLVIMTHLHWDHIGQMGAFPNARIIVQASEIPWAFTPPKWARGYFRALLPSLTAVADRMDTVDGDATIVDGVRVIRVGGHSPGSQLVSIRTPNGEVTVAGDTVMVYDSLERDVPVGLFHNIDEAYKVLDLLREPGRIVLPGHDWRVMERYGDGV